MMGTVPDLYDCPANNLDKYISDYLQPNEEFLRQVRAAVDTICGFLKENCYRGHRSGIKVEEVVKGGSSAKGTALKTGSDADLVVYLNCIKSYDDQNKKRKEIIDEIREKMEECQKLNQFEVIFEKTKWDNPRVLSFRLRSEKVKEFIEFDVLPAYDALGQRNSKGLSKAEVYADLINNSSEGDNFSTCFTKLQVKFIISRDTKLKSLIRLVKHWYKTKLTGKKKLPPKYALELLCIHAWEEGSGGEKAFNMAQAFRNVLELICNYQYLCVYWTENYNSEDHEDVAKCLSDQFCKPGPVILDPADPTGNLGEKCDWAEVAKEAKNCLYTMHFRAAASQVLLFKELPPSVSVSPSDQHVGRFQSVDQRRHPSVYNNECHSPLSLPDSLISQNLQSYTFAEQRRQPHVYNNEHQSPPRQEPSSIWSYCTIL